MKTKLISALACILLVSSVPAAVVVDGYEQGKSSVGDDGFVIVAYPSGWNPKNEALGKAILNSPELLQAAGQAVIIGVGVPNNSTKEVRDARAKKLGPIKLDKGPGANAGSYPAIFLCDKSGNYYSIIISQEFRKPGLPKDEMTKQAVSGAGKLVAKRMESARKQRKLMEQAGKASGKEQIELIAQACNIKDISRPGNALELAKKADPNDESGILAMLNHNFYGFIESCGNAGEGEWQAKLAEAEKKIDNPYFSPQVKQTIYTSAVGLLRRHAGSSGYKKMISYLKAMKKLDPKSPYGRSYDGAMRLWDAWTTPWNPNNLPSSDATPMRIEAPTIKKPGVYTVTFNYSRGRDAFRASAVTLYDGDAKVAEDIHVCNAGHSHTDHVYTLNVTKKVSKPRLQINTSMGGSRDSHGVISIRCD